MLAEHGYWVDSTVTPRVSRRLERGPDFALASAAPSRVADARLWEVPMTIGLNRGERLIRAGGVGRALLNRYLQLASLELLGLPRPVKAA